MILWYHNDAMFKNIEENDINNSANDVSYSGVVSVKV